VKKKGEEYTHREMEGYRSLILGVREKTSWKGDNLEAGLTIHYQWEWEELRGGIVAQSGRGLKKGGQEPVQIYWVREGGGGEGRRRNGTGERADWVPGVFARKVNRYGPEGANYWEKAEKKGGGGDLRGGKCDERRRVVYKEGMSNISCVKGGHPSEPGSLVSTKRNRFKKIPNADV